MTDKEAFPKYEIRPGNKRRITVKTENIYCYTYRNNLTRDEFDKLKNRYLAHLTAQSEGERAGNTEAVKIIMGIQNLGVKPWVEAYYAAALEFEKMGSEPTINRTPSDVRARLNLIVEKMRSNEVYIRRGDTKILDPNSQRNLDILQGKFEELYWILGVDIEATKGTY